MAKSNKINMPMGQGGLTRYFDEYRSNIVIKPGHVVVLVIIVIVIEMILFLRGGAILGL